MPDPKQPDPGSIQVSTGDEMSRGRFSNSVLITHGPDEFFLDWLLNSPSGTHLVSRVVVTPAHLKRIVAAMQENLDRYEVKFGEIRLMGAKDQNLQ